MSKAYCGENHKYVKSRTTSREEVRRHGDRLKTKGEKFFYLSRFADLLVVEDEMRENGVVGWVPRLF